MPSIPHVERRGAVHYWRRRLPAGAIKDSPQSQLVLSLGTTDPAVARRLAAVLDGKVAMLGSAGETEVDHRLSAEQLKGILSKVASKRSWHLRCVAQADRRISGFDPADSRRSDRTMGHVFRLFATDGVKAMVTEATRVGLQEAG